MMARCAEARSSVRKTVLFWWILSVVMQTTERLFLLRDAFAQETPTLSLLLHTLAQNPILFASEASRVAWVSRGSMAQRANTEIMPYDVAVRTAQGLLGPGEVFPNPRYPLVRAMMANADGIRFTEPANVIILFLEGLDPRYLGQTYGEVRGTPFLDRLREDSVYFTNFFSNGVQTSWGLFATLCSTYPRHGDSAMKTRYAHDYLCLPSLLQRQSYSTEMVIGQLRDLNRLQTFFSRNGLQQLLDEGDFPLQAERAGLGIVDGPLFDLCYERIKPCLLAGIVCRIRWPISSASTTIWSG